jgi:hypothetical protein
MLPFLAIEFFVLILMLLVAPLTLTLPRALGFI